MDLAGIRCLVIIAMFSDDVLFSQLALKGGNALNLVYRLGSRVSVDVDFSLEQDFPDVDEARDRIFRALKDRFREAGLTVFDEVLLTRPAAPLSTGDEKFGGYEVQFKVMESVKYGALKDDLDRRRRESEVVGPLQQRTFRVQISKYEYCAGKRDMELDDYTIRVYTPEMLAIEKLRAICQQMSEYPLRGHRTARARDFYDIHAIVTAIGMNLGAPENLQLTRDIFAAKEVPLGLIPQIPRYQEFHKQDWPAVELTVSDKLRDFDFYFGFVIDQTRLLESLWNE
jgi:hypothetical protein